MRRLDRRLLARASSHTSQDVRSGICKRAGTVCSVEVDRDPEPLAALPDSYRPLFESLLAVCENDPRIRALWLSGSLAKGTADGGSDVPYGTGD